MDQDISHQLTDLLSLFGRIRGGEVFDVLSTCPPHEVPILQREMDIVSKAHAGQFRRDNGRPYFDHVTQVWALTRLSGGTFDDQLAALYHDVPEDCEAALNKSAAEIIADIGQRLNAHVSEMVAQLTDPRPNMPFEEKIARAAALTGGARLVKLADSLCNFYDVLMTPPRDWSVEKIRDYIDYRCRMVKALQPAPALPNALLAHILVGMQQQWGADILPSAA